MAKKITLVALVKLSHEGRVYGHNMQFTAEAEDAERLVKSKQADYVDGAQKEVKQPLVEKPL